MVAKSTLGCFLFFSHRYDLVAGFLTFAFLFTFSLLDVLGAGLDGLVLQEDP